MILEVVVVVAVNGSGNTNSSSSTSLHTVYHSGGWGGRGGEGSNVGVLTIYKMFNVGPGQPTTNI